jgi:hypothetical protein
MFKKIVFFCLIIVLILVGYTQYYRKDIDIEENINIKIGMLENKNDRYVLVLELKNNTHVDIKNFNIYISFPSYQEESNVSCISSVGNPEIKFSKKPNVNILKKEIICSVAFYKNVFPDNIDYENPVISITGFYKNEIIDYDLELSELINLQKNNK